MYEVFCDGFTDDNGNKCPTAFMVVSAGGRVMERFVVNRLIPESEANQRRQAHTYCNRLNGVERLELKRVA
jgi:hypothetical protein